MKLVCRLPSAISLLITSLILILSYISVSLYFVMSSQVANNRIRIVGAGSKPALTIQ